MSRLPFDPSRVRGAAPARAVPPRSADAPLTVTQVAEVISNALSAGVPAGLRVVGEVSNLTRRNHWYFALKDETSVLKCVAWASKARTFGFEAADGMEVVATGTVQYYGPQGQCQLYVDRLEPVGAGALELKFRALCEELRALGYFAPERKRPLPYFPRRIAVITSPTGAAIHDVLDTMKRRCPAVAVLLVPVRVQGAQAAPEIVAALKRVAKIAGRRGIDAVILTRGGGSMEDLWAFNERIVAEALFNSPLPVVAAIGHETDTTIAELVADVRAATPTQAAMMVTPNRSDLSAQLDQLQRRLSAFVRTQVRFETQRLERLRAQLGTPQDLVRRARETLEERGRDLHGVFAANLRERRQHLNTSERLLDSLNPRRVLSRGYSMTCDAKGKILRSSTMARAGALVRTTLHDGSFTSRVVEEGEPPKRRTEPPESPEQLPLF